MPACAITTHTVHLPFDLPMTTILPHTTPPPLPSSLHCAYPHAADPISLPHTTLCTRALFLIAVACSVLRSRTCPREQLSPQTVAAHTCRFAWEGGRLHLPLHVPFAFWCWMRCFAGSDHSLVVRPYRLVWPAAERVLLPISPSLPAIRGSSTTACNTRFAARYVFASAFSAPRRASCVNIARCYLCSSPCSFRTVNPPATADDCYTRAFRYARLTVRDTVRCYHFTPATLTTLLLHRLLLPTTPPRWIERGVHAVGFALALDIKHYPCPHRRFTYRV